MEEVVSVRANLGPGEQLGLGLSNSQTVVKVHDEGALAGKIEVGDCVLAINGQDLQQLSREQLVEYMTQLQGEIVVSVRRPAKSTPVITVETATPEHTASSRPQKLRRRGVVGTDTSQDTHPLHLKQIPEQQKQLPEQQNETPEHFPDEHKQELNQQESNQHELPEQPKRIMHPASLLRTQFGESGKRLSFTPQQPPRRNVPMQPSKTIDFGELPQWRARPVITLHNYSTGEQTVDRLHTQGGQVGGLHVLCRGCFEASLVAL